MERSDMRTASARPVPWQAIHRDSFIYEDQCWKTCNGGACCKIDHPEYDFQLFPKTGTIILYLEDEYRWFGEHGKAAGETTTGSTPQVISFDFGGPRPLTLIQVGCKLLGQCQGVIDKPLLCKVFPMMPVLGIDGSVQEIVPASIFELTMQLMGFKTLCTIIDKTKLYWHKWKAKPELLRSLNHPYLILHLQAAKHFADVYREELLQSEALRGLTGKAFWSAWEIEYLLGNLIDADLLARKLLQTYEQIVAVHGCIEGFDRDTAGGKAA
jgi:hypothetical protein